MKMEEECKKNYLVEAFDKIQDKGISSRIFPYLSLAHLVVSNGNEVFEILSFIFPEVRM